MLDRHFGFIVLLAILCSLPGIQTSARNVYVIAPRYTIPESDYVATVDMMNFLEQNPGTYDVLVSLRATFSSPNIVSETKALSKANSRGIFTLRIPRNHKTSGWIYVHVTSDGISYGSTSLYTSNRFQTDDVILVQTDKGVYKAGQTVQFRVMLVNRRKEIEVRPMTIDILDGDKNRIRRWANVTDNSGVFVGKMEMSQYPVLGTWSIKVTSDAPSKTQEFEVQEYELPKFDVTINMPEVVTSIDKSLEGNVSSLYTFGKGVTGSLEFILSYYTRKLSKIYKLNDGQVDIEITTSDIYEVLSINPTSIYSLYTVKATAIVTEDITGNTREDSVHIKFMKFDVSMKMESPATFFVGQPFIIKGRVTSRLGSSYAGEAADLYGLRISVEYRVLGSYINKIWINDQVLPINNRNQFSFTVDGNLITDQVTTIKTKIRLIRITTKESLRTFYSYAYTLKTANGSLLTVKQVTGSNPMNVGETATYRISMTGPGTLTATYKVISKGIIVKNGNWFTISEHSSYDLEVKATTSMKPLFAVLSWFILPNDRITSVNSYDNVAVSGVTTSITDNMVAQKTSIAFQKEILKPGENARLNMKSSSMSSFYVLAVDKSVLLLDEGNDITEALLPDLYDDLLTDIDFGSSRSASDYLSRAKLQLRMFGLRLPLSTTTTSSTLFSSTPGLQFSISSAVSLSTAPPIPLARPLQPLPMRASIDRLGNISGPPVKIETKRKKFPDTWLFLNASADWLEDETSGMVVVEIGIPSGFEANRWGISEHELLKRTEIEDRKVILYYEEVQYKIEICTDIRFVRDKMVAKTKPVPCKAYEYYEPSNQVTVFYAPLSAKNANICDICGTECGCQTTKEKIWFPQSWCKKKV